MAKNSSVYFKNSVKSLNILTIKTQRYQYIMGNLGFRTQLSLLFWEQIMISHACFPEDLSWLSHDRSNFVFCWICIVWFI